MNNKPLTTWPSHLAKLDWPSSNRKYVESPLWIWASKLNFEPMTRTREEKETHEKRHKPSVLSRAWLDLWTLKNASANKCACDAGKCFLFYNGFLRVLREGRGMLAEFRKSASRNGDHAIAQAETDWSCLESRIARRNSAAAREGCLTFLGQLPPRAEI